MFLRKFKLYILGRLVPNFKMQGTIDTPAFVWLDERPYPTDEEFALEWNKYQIELEIEKSNSEAKAEYEVTLNTSFEHKGNIYVCDETFSMNMTKLLALDGVRPITEVKLLDADNNVRTMTIEDFEVFAALVGEFQYGALAAYWDKLK